MTTGRRPRSRSTNSNWFPKEPRRRPRRAGFGWWLLAAVLGYAQSRSSSRSANPFALRPAPRRAAPRKAPGGKSPMGTGGGVDARRSKNHNERTPTMPKGLRPAPVDTGKRHGPEFEEVTGVWEDGTDEQPPDEEYAHTSDDPDWEWDPEIVPDPAPVDDEIVIDDPQPKAVTSDYSWM